VNRVQFVTVVYVRQTPAGRQCSINFEKIALYWIWNHEDCSRFSEILL